MYSFILDLAKKLTEKKRVKTKQYPEGNNVNNLT